MNKSLCLTLLIAFLGGCVVLPEEYYFPEAQGAYSEQQDCRGNVGAENQLVFERDSVKLVLSVREASSENHLNLSIYVYGSADVVWPTQTIIGLVDDSPLEFQISNFRRIRVKNGEIKTKDYAIGELMSRYTTEEYDMYHHRVKLKNKEAKKISIRKVSLLVDGVEESFENITFTRTMSVYLHPLNC